MGLYFVPSTVREDGTIDRTTPALGYGTANQGPGAIIMKNAKDKEAAWGFLKWWTSLETQVNLAVNWRVLWVLQQVSCSSKYKEHSTFAWQVEELEVLLEQWE